MKYFELVNLLDRVEHEGWNPFDVVSIRTMTEEQHEQSERLTQLEDRDGEMWRKVVSHTVTVIIGILIGFVFKQIGM